MHAEVYYLFTKKSVSDQYDLKCIVAKKKCSLI